MDDEEFIDEYVRRAKEIAGYLRKVYEDTTIAWMEESLNGTSSYVLPVPTPNWAHPAYTHVKDFVIKRNMPHVVVCKAPPTKAYDKKAAPGPEDLVKKTVLVRHTAWGHAPFVGNPKIMGAVYTWPVWVDDLNRGVGGEATLEIFDRNESVR